MLEISKTFTFDAAHRLTCVDKDHPCRNLHGHTYSLTVTLSTKEINSNSNMVIDYRSLSVIKDYIDSQLDHCILIDFNDNLLIEASDLLESEHCILPINATTCECIVVYLKEEFKRLLGIGEHASTKEFKDISMSITLSETPKTSCTLTD